ncbi:hypothetical protein [Streptomyces acidiscabies]|uniref:Uncharacterized protein n=1 Tax=Streptomyces acidiscabies TaxID=42234 RepID=A0ABU4LWL8_9ACTN|nr:hypothetical protein [Streptomyces acidiscabies]MDX3019896.1 hypothetical protein [Streptomyces acidiscabies]
MIAEAIDTLITLGWWMVGWIAVLAAAVTVVLFAGTLLGTWAVRGAWRHVIRPSWAYGRVFAARRIRRSTSRTAPHDYREAA